ncbi:MAG: SDR family NAD(P)-dependent oxidoreductase [Planctomycetota bacterium]|nr:SDR family NAD(P)-dependent oxidoreductase [Planctomycetota bacterium]
MNKPTVLVTGAAGFIGSHAAEHLLTHGYHVVAVDNFCDFYERAWKELNLASVGGRVKFDVEEIDITDGAAIDKLVGLAKPQVILHLAGMAGVRPSIEQPAYYARVNVEGTTQMLQAAVNHKVQRFVFASSSSVYGNRTRVPFREDEPVSEPISPYAASKRAGELICYTYWHLYRLPVFCLRFFTVYGPRLRPDLAIHKFTRLIAQGRPIPFYGDGTTARDYTYIDDICSGILAAVERADRFRIYNLGNHHPVPLKEMVSALEKAIGRPAILDRKPMQPGDVEITCADVSRAVSELDYRPSVTLEDGLKKFVDWFNQYGHLYRLPGEAEAGKGVA